MFNTNAKSLPLISSLQSIPLQKCFGVMKSVKGIQRFNKNIQFIVEYQHRLINSRILSKHILICDTAEHIQHHHT